MKYLLNSLYILLSAIILSSCSTLSTGSRYYAKIVVKNHPEAYIFYKNKSLGKGEANLNLPREMANDLSFTIIEDSCNTERHNFKQRKFRWGTTAISLLFTPVFGITPIPLGIAIDGGTGACWQPDINELGVTKQDIDHFTYTINYTGCPDVITLNNEDKVKKLDRLYINGNNTAKKLNTEKKKLLQPAK